MLLQSVQTTKIIWIGAKLLTVNLQRQHLQVVAMIAAIIVAAAPANPTDIPMIWSVFSLSAPVVPPVVPLARC